MLQESSSRPVFAPRFVAALVFLAPALSLVVTTATSAAGLLLAALGAAAWLRSRNPSGQQAPDRRQIGQRWVVWPLLLYAAVMLLENLYHGERWGAYHVVLAIALSLPAYLAFSAPGPAFRSIWLGAALGAILALGMALYLVFVLGHGRAGGHINPIPFGNLSLVLAAASVLGTRHINPNASHRRWVFAIHLLGGLAGLVASLLSGSRGGWPAILVLGFVAYDVYWKTLPAGQKLVAGALLAGILVLVLSLPQVAVMSRLQSALNSLQAWEETGSVADGSVGPRLESWQFGLDVALEKPWLGFGKPGMMERKQQAVDAGLYAPIIAVLVTLHNEFLNLWVTKGIVGVAALALLYGGAFMMFFRLRHATDERLRTISLMGRSLIIMYLIFGLSEVAFQLNAYRNAFLFWLLSLTGMALGLAKERDMEVTRDPSRVTA